MFPAGNRAYRRRGHLLNLSQPRFCLGYVPAESAVQTACFILRY